MLGLRLYLGHLYSQWCQKISYNRSTNSAVFCALQRMSLPPPFPSMQHKWLPLFLLWGSEPITIKGCDFRQSCNPYTP